MCGVCVGCVVCVVWGVYVCGVYVYSMLCVVGVLALTVGVHLLPGGLVLHLQ